MAFNLATAKPVTRFDSATATPMGYNEAPPELIKAMIEAESSSNPNAVSKKGAKGLMQLMPKTAKMLGIVDSSDPDENIKGGTRYMNQLLRWAKGDPVKALAAYNWGMGNVTRKGLENMPEETRNHLTKVLTNAGMSRFLGEIPAKPEEAYAGKVGKFPPPMDLNQPFDMPGKPMPEDNPFNVIRQPKKQQPDAETRQAGEVMGSITSGWLPTDVPESSVMDPGHVDTHTKEGISLLSSALPFAPSATKSAFKMGGEALGEVATHSGMRSGQKGVIKLKGGNWLSGSVEDSLKPLRKKSMGQEPTERIKVLEERLQSPDIDPGYKGTDEFVQTVNHDLALQRRNAATNEFVDKTLTSYVKNRMASPEDEVRLLADRKVEELEKQKATALKEVAKIRARAEKVRAEGPRSSGPEGERVWQTAVDNQLQNADRLETEALAAHESGMNHALHAPRFAARVVKNDRITEMGQSAPARRWETAADSQVQIKPAKKLKEYPGEVAKNSWLQTTPDDVPVYNFSKFNTPADLGFDHLVDELHNAMSDTTLPQNLRLTPEAVKQMSMEKAVSRVADINKWRAEQKIIADKELASKVDIVREYKPTPELPNPQGLRWVEIKAKDAPLPEGFTVRPAKKGGYEVISKDGGLVAYGGTEKEAIKNANADDLDKQLKYEGSTMQHCVGGYCDDVISGQSRVFSLRDSKGEPHVTIETGKDSVSTNEGPWRSALGIDQQTMDALRSEWEALPRSTGGFYTWLNAKYPDAFVDSQGIVQIKGKQNKKPADQYLPFVQDFVRNSPHGGQWSNIGDFENTGLINRAELYDKHPTRLGLPAELYDPTKVSAKALADKLPAYFTKEELITAAKELLGKPK